VKVKKKVLIITDDAEATRKLALDIAAVIKNNEVIVKAASDFMGNDILPAEAFFLSCEKPGPDSFRQLEDVLKHINLAGRPCGVFTPGSEKAAKYLAGLVKDCEAALHPEYLFAGSGTDIKAWAQNVVSNSF